MSGGKLEAVVAQLRAQGICIGSVGNMPPMTSKQVAQDLAYLRLVATRYRLSVPSPRPLTR